jgi:hypothetical protein
MMVVPCGIEGLISSAYRRDFLPQKKEPSMRNLILAITVTTALLGAAISPVWAGGNHVGWDTETSDPTNGNSGNDNGNTSNNGTSSTKTDGPKGQLDKGNTDCNNCETTPDLPGKNR